MTHNQDFPISDSLYHPVPGPPCKKVQWFEGTYEMDITPLPTSRPNPSAGWVEGMGETQYSGKVTFDGAFCEWCLCAYNTPRTYPCRAPWTNPPSTGGHNRPQKRGDFCTSIEEDLGPCFKDCPCGPKCTPLKVEKDYDKFSGEALGWLGDPDTGLKQGEYTNHLALEVMMDHISGDDYENLCDCGGMAALGSGSDADRTTLTIFKHCYTKTKVVLNYKFHKPASTYTIPGQEITSGLTGEVVNTIPDRVVTYYPLIYMEYDMVITRECVCTDVDPQDECDDEPTGDFEMDAEETWECTKYVYCCALCEYTSTTTGQVECPCVLNEGALEFSSDDFAIAESGSEADVEEACALALQDLIGATNNLWRCACSTSP